jgi:VanZ family protein
MAYLAIVVLATLTPLSPDLYSGVTLERVGRMLNPLVSGKDVARNVVLFAGWGLVWMLTARSVRSMASIRNAVLTGGLISVSVESAQLFSSHRTASILDVFANTSGALLGAVTVILMVLVVSDRRQDRSFFGMPALVFAWSYAAAALGEALVPLLRQEAYPNAFGGPLRKFRVSTQMFEWSSLADVPFGDVLLFVPAGALAVVAWVESGRRYQTGVVLVTLVGLVLSGMAEVSHGFLGVHIQAGAALAHSVGVTMGALASALWLPSLARVLRGRSRPMALLAMYGLVLALWALRPYLPVTSLGSVGEKLASPWWIPLGIIRQRFDVLGLVDVSATFLLYLPLGALLAVWPLARNGWLAFIWPVAYLALATEVTQLFVVGRYMDVTDVLVQIAGAAVGWAVLRRAGFTPHGTLVRASD